MADKKNAYEWWKNTPGPKNFLQEVIRTSVQGKSAVIDVPLQDLEGFLRVFSDEMSLLNLSPSVELMENMFFADEDEGFGNRLIYESFKEEYIKLIRGRRAIIPCNNDSYKSIHSVLFTSESENNYSLMVELFGMKWLSDFFGVQSASGVCWVDYSSGYYEFIEESFGCRKMTIEEVVHSLRANYYEEKTTEWFVEFVGLLVEKNYYGFEVRINGLDKLPLIRTNKHKHRTVAQAGKIYLNNGKDFEIHFWDTAGQEKYRALT